MPYYSILSSLRAILLLTAATQHVFAFAAFSTKRRAGLPPARTTTPPPAFAGDRSNNNRRGLQSTASNYLEQLSNAGSSSGVGEIPSYCAAPSSTNGGVSAGAGSSSDHQEEEAFSYVPTLNLAQADMIANNVVACCQRNGFAPVTVHVLDASGSTLVSKRMDGCSPVGIPDFSRAKAFGCIVNKYPSRAFRDRYTSEETSAKFCQMTTMVALSDNRMAPFPGGIVLQTTDGYVIGAVGVSGAAGDEDEYCAITAVKEASIPGLTTVPAEHSCSTVNEPR